MISKERQAQFLKDNVEVDSDTIALISDNEGNMRLTECSLDYVLEDNEDVLIECFSPNTDIVEQDDIKNIISILNIEDY